MVLGAAFDGANMMYGRFIGEFLGELLLNVAFVLFSAVTWRDRAVPRWVSGVRGGGGCDRAGGDVAERDGACGTRGGCEQCSAAGVADRVGGGVVAGETGVSAGAYLRWVDHSRWRGVTTAPTTGAGDNACRSRGQVSL